MQKQSLHIGTWMISSGVNGPGRRFVLWLQGCRLCCPGCLNPEFQDEQGGTNVSVAAVREMILSVLSDIEGVTFSGGEPMLQAETLLTLARWIKDQGLGLMAYSGYTLEELSRAGSIPGARALLAELDILVDGPFLADRKAGLLWRGSRNQQLRFLTGRYVEYRELADKQNTGYRAELQINKGDLAMTGFFSVGLWEKIQKKLSEKKQITGERRIL